MMTTTTLNKYIKLNKLTEFRNRNKNEHTKEFCMHKSNQNHQKCFTRRNKTEHTKRGLHTEIKMVQKQQRIILINQNVGTNLHILCHYT